MALHKSTLLKASLAVALTLLVGFGLFINSRSAKAIDALLGAPSSSSVTQGTAVTFNAALEITNPNEVIPISRLELALTGPENHSISFSPLGFNVTGSTSVLSVTAIPVTALGAGYGYAFGYAPARFGYIGGYGYNFGGGYGYGRVSAFSGAVGYIRSFDYSFSVNTTNLTPGLYTLTLIVHLDAPNISQFSSNSRTFTVVASTSGGGAGPIIPTTPVTSPVPSPSATVPPAAESVVIAPAINFSAVAQVIQPGVTIDGNPVINVSSPNVVTSTNAQGQTFATVTLSSGASGTVTISIPVAPRSGTVNGNTIATITGAPVLTVTSTAPSVNVGGGASMGTVTISSTLGSLPTSGTATISIAPPSQIPATTTSGISSFVVSAGGGSANVIGAVVFDHPGITSVGSTTIAFTLQNPGALTNPAVIQESGGVISNPPATFTPQTGGNVLVTINAASASTFAVVTLAQPIPTPTPVPTVTPTGTAIASPTVTTVPPTATTTVAPGATPTATPRPGSVGDVNFSGTLLAMMLGAGILLLMLASAAVRKSWK